MLNSRWFLHYTFQLCPVLLSSSTKFLNLVYCSDLEFPFDFLMIFNFLMNFSSINMLGFLEAEPELVILLPTDLLRECP